MPQTEAPPTPRSLPVETRIIMPTAGARPVHILPPTNKERKLCCMGRYHTDTVWVRCGITDLRPDRLGRILDSFLVRQGSASLTRGEDHRSSSLWPFCLSSNHRSHLLVNSVQPTPTPTPPPPSSQRLHRGGLPLAPLIPSMSPIVVVIARSRLLASCHSIS